MENKQIGVTIPKSISGAPKKYKRIDTRMKKGIGVKKFNTKESAEHIIGL